MTGDGLPSALPPMAKFSAPFHLYTGLYFSPISPTPPGKHPEKFMRLSDFPRSDNFSLLQRKFFCVMLRLASGKEAVVMTNAMCASLMHTTSAQAPCAASSCADMHAILGIIILDASLLLGSVFVLLSSVTRTVRSLPSLQAC
jgi:hypothetical protein